MSLGVMNGSGRSRMSGAGDDARYFQISVPVQPGNSGGAGVGVLKSLTTDFTDGADGEKEICSIRVIRAIRGE